MHFTKSLIAAFLAITAGANPLPASGPRAQGVQARAPGGYTNGTSLRLASTGSDNGAASGADTYIFYQGDGSMGAGWPDQSQWVSFDDMWTNYQSIIRGSCSAFGQADNSDAEIDAIQAAIGMVAGETGVDNRFILAIVMQESKGCVRAPTTGTAVRNPGLMQDHDGQGTCNDKDVVQNPCPNDTITLMIREGTAGTAAGDGLQQCLQQAAGSDASAFYRTARIYNAGSIPPSGDLGAPGATPCYCSDVANRLTGWVNAPSTCTL